VCNHPDGIIKPDIVFFGENLGNKFAELLDVDRQKCDLVIVIGSSLQVRWYINLCMMLNCYSEAALSLQ
jgi:NAD-dependent SIR2 family protein deacetylase